jgi:LemA protein
MESAGKFEGGLKSIKTSEIKKMLSNLIALAEQYPDLKATQSFQDLMNMVEITENRLASMRENYINLVRDYNTFMVTFPSNVFNVFFGFEMIDYYHFEDAFVPQIHKSDVSGKKKK